MAYWSTGVRNRVLGLTTNMLTNPNFTSNTTGWTAVNSASLAAAGSGQAGNCLEITNSGASLGAAYQDITVVPGRTYMVRGYFKKGTATSGVVMAGISGDTDKYARTEDMVHATWTQFSFAVVPAAAQTTLRVTFQNSADSAATGYFDTLEVFPLYNGLKDIFKNCAINIYTGARPGSPYADAAASGTLLATFTACNFDDSSGAVLSKATAETWTANAVATGTAGYAIVYEETGVPGNASTTEARFMMTVGTSGAECNLNTVSLVSSGPITISAATVTFPFGS